MKDCHLRSFCQFEPTLGDRAGAQTEQKAAPCSCQSHGLSGNVLKMLDAMQLWLVVV